MTVADTKAHSLFPKPVIDAVTRPWWDAAAEGRLEIQRCDSCDAWLWQPTPVCSRCQTLDPRWVQVSGAGQITSWTVIRPPTLPVYAELVPLVVLLVELDEGVRLLGNLVDAQGHLLKTDGIAEGIHIGQKVGVRFMKQGELTLPCWTVDC